MAPIERIITDACNTIRDRYASKVGATRERPITDDRKAVRNNYISNSTHTVNRIFITVYIVWKCYSFFSAAICDQFILIILVSKQEVIIGQRVFIVVIFIAGNTIIYKNLSIISYISVIATSCF